MVARKPRPQPVPALEWIAAALGLAVLVALVAILGAEMLRGTGDETPRLSVRVTAIERYAGSHVARFTITNASPRTAAEVQVEGKLGADVATATIDYVPGRSEAHGALVFAADPRGAGIRVVGFELP